MASRDCRRPFGSSSRVALWPLSRRRWRASGVGPEGAARRNQVAAACGCPCCRRLGRELPVSSKFSSVRAAADSVASGAVRRGFAYRGVRLFGGRDLSDPLPHASARPSEGAASCVRRDPSRGFGDASSSASSRFTLAPNSAIATTLYPQKCGAGDSAQRGSSAYREEPLTSLPSPNKRVQRTRLRFAADAPPVRPPKVAVRLRAPAVVCLVVAFSVVEWRLAMATFEPVFIPQRFDAWVEEQEGGTLRHAFLRSAPILLQPSLGLFRHYVNTSGRSWSGPPVRWFESQSSSLGLSVEFAAFALLNTVLWLIAWGAGVLAWRRLRRAQPDGAAA